LPQINHRSFRFAVPGFIVIADKELVVAHPPHGDDSALKSSEGKRHD
jgi:hypothetical protein